MKQKTVNYKLVLFGLLLFIGILFFVNLEGQRLMTNTLAVTVLIAFLWCTEALPIGLTSMLPLVLFPTFGILDGKLVSEAYINHVIFLFIAGFIIALTIEKWNLHQRIALKILSYTGTSFFRIMLGFMLCSSLLSMWISNTAAAMMMIPIGLSVVTVLNKKGEESKMRKFNTHLFLSIAYACSIGGVGTLIGTPPNLSYARISEVLFPKIPEISFAQWMIMALPIVVVMFMIVLFLLYFTSVPKGKSKLKLEGSYFKKEYNLLGHTTTEQKRVFYVFLLLIFLWLFRRELVLGDFYLPGWSQLFPFPHFVNDGTVAVFVVLLLFLIPSSDKQKPLVTWEITRKIPWDVVFLLGGGFAIAKAFVVSGLSVYLGEQLMFFFTSRSDVGILGMLVGFIVFLTEITSNTATTEIMLPVISGVAKTLRCHPIILMLSVTLASSMAFMFPVATAPNALVFGTGKIKMLEMIKIGFLLNLLAVMVIVLVVYFWIPYVFQIDFHTFPDWAQ
ncbi:SLC13 family permease [Wenyingzhuangia sp.]|uniref:SLC13 family permease n=1 Tax=Wenyingzhuangia sp. TaxID=1964193 RepID=UPI00321B6641